MYKSDTVSAGAAVTLAMHSLLAKVLLLCMSSTLPESLETYGSWNACKRRAWLGCLEQLFQSISILIR